MNNSFEALLHCVFVGGKHHTHYNNTICNPFFKNIVYDQNQIIHRTHMHLPPRIDLVGKSVKRLNLGAICPAFFKNGCGL